MHRDPARAGGLGSLLGGVHRCRAPGRRLLLGHSADEPHGQEAIAGIPETAWTPIKYPRVIWDDQLGCWISDAEVAEVEYPAFTSKKDQAITARLIVRRVRDLNRKAACGQDELFRSGVTTPYSPIPRSGPCRPRSTMATILPRSNRCSPTSSLWIRQVSKPRARPQPGRDVVTAGDVNGGARQHRPQARREGLAGSGFLARPTR